MAALTSHLFSVHHTVHHTQNAPQISALTSQLFFVHNAVPKAVHFTPYFGSPPKRSPHGFPDQLAVHCTVYTII